MGFRLSDTTIAGFILMGLLFVSGIILLHLAYIMWTHSQFLSVVGLIFPLLSVLYQGTKVYHPFKSKEEKKMKYIEKEYAKISDQIAEKEKTWFWSFVLFFIGFLFQVIAKFV